MPLIDILARFVNVYSKFKKGSYAEIEETMVVELLALEAELNVWQAQVPETWTFTVEPTTDGHAEGVFREQTHIYRDLW